MDWEEIRYSDLWPADNSLSAGDHDSSIRHEALARVLLRLPPADVSSLAERFGERCAWLIPPLGTRGLVDRAHARVQPDGETQAEAPYCDVVYLSPLLERGSLDVAIAVVAHELAHIFREHRIRCDVALYGRQEREAQEQVAAWGFDREARKLAAIHKRLDRAEDELALEEEMKMA